MDVSKQQHHQLCVHVMSRACYKNALLKVFDIHVFTLYSCINILIILACVDAVRRNPATEMTLVEKLQSTQDLTERS